jgi:hypothetical protein
LNQPIFRVFQDFFRGFSPNVQDLNPSLRSIPCATEISSVVTAMEFPAPVRTVYVKGTDYEGHLDREDAEDRSDQDPCGSLSLLQPRLLIASTGR